MNGFVLGLVTGATGALVAAASVGVWVYRRFVRLERSAQEAQRLAELGTLTGGLAHEIKNPLSTVQLNLQLMQEDLDPHDASHARLRNRLATVHQEAGRLKGIVDDFLRYAGRIELDRKSTDLNLLLEELADFYTPQAQAQGVQLRLNRSNGALVAPVDERLLKQAVLNLMINGLQAMPSGGELILSAAPNGRGAVIDVIDTGSGISPDDQNRIFDAYFSKKRGGTGLGLAMTRRIVEEHGGTISLSSEPGKGSDFSIHLPTS